VMRSSMHGVLPPLPILLPKLSHINIYFSLYGLHVWC
jgi:hypothetical protein